MERLAKRIDLGNGEYAYDFSNERAGEFLTDHEGGVRELFKAVCEYEDTNLTQDQLREIDKLYAEKCKELAELKQAEENGLLLRLPCKVGDKLHYMQHHIPSKPPICEMVVKKIEIHGNGKYVYLLEFVSSRGMLLRFYDDDFEKTIFLTREEAEAALAEMEGGHENYKK